MNDFNYKILGQKLIEKHPEIAKDLVNKIAFYNLDFIPEIKKFIFSHERLKGVNDFEKKEVVICVVLKLYDPDHLEGYKKMRAGLRDVLSHLLECSPARISHLSIKVRNLASIYKDFEYNVDYFANLIIEKFC